jgi:hypothetical protein
MPFSIMNYSFRQLPELPHFKNINSHLALFHIYIVWIIAPIKGFRAPKVEKIPPLLLP